MTSNVNYDEFLREVDKCCEEAEPSWVIARDLETALAFAQWCVDNDIEEPQIAIKPSTPKGVE